jgi:acyl carrier protein
MPIIEKSSFPLDALETITDIVQQILNLDTPPAPDADLREKSLDSLAVVSIFVHLEGTYGITFPTEALNIDNFTSIEKIYNLASKHVANQ